MTYQKVTERKTFLVVPGPGRAGAGERTVFFNPQASTNRDISVALADALGPRTFCDSMAGVGARGIRIANEVPGVEEVTLVDANAESLRLARRAARLNGVLERCRFIHGETNATLLSESQGKARSDCVDLDPFGSPARHLQAVISATADRGVASMTATDTAVLCGVHRQVCRRRYASSSLNNSFHHETAVRILLNSARRVASSLDVGISPVAAHSTRHYVRVYFMVEVGASKADANLRDEGYLLCCRSCGHVESSARPGETCQVCGGKNGEAGPLWVGKVSEPRVVSLAAQRAEKKGMKEAARILASLDSVNSFPPWSYSIEEACSWLGVATASEQSVVDYLSSMGFRAARQPFEGTGLKTDAGYAEFLEAVKGASKIR